MDPAATQEKRLVHNVGRRRAWAIWAVAVSVYVLSVFHRSSLGVAGLLAADRFELSATQLATFTVLQLFVYAGLQVPVGVLLDRYGSRAMLLLGLTLLTAGQLAFAFATSFPVAVLARAVLGAGDAMIFVSVLRLVTVWFLVRQASVVVQLTGQIGQLGAIIAAAPMSVALHSLGWTRTFAAASAVGLVGLVGVALLVKDSPYAGANVVRIRMAALARSLLVVWGNPGTRLGLWSHFTSQFSVTVFSLLWGFPFLVGGQGLSPSVASTLLMLMTGWGVVSGLVLARLVPKYPFYRSWIVITVVLVMAAVWAVVLLWPGRAPLWLLVLLACAIAAGGPASMVGFDLARTFMPVSAVGRANGFVNVGGFVASLLTMWLIGAVIDLRAPAGATYTLDDFKAAMSVQYLLWAGGIVMILRHRRRAVRHLQRFHPGAVERMKAGETFAHLGGGNHEGV